MKFSKNVKNIITVSPNKCRTIQELPINVGQFKNELFIKPLINE